MKNSLLFTGIIGLLLIIISVILWEKYRQSIGSVNTHEYGTEYSNLNLILSLDNTGYITLLGKGDNSSGHYSISFKNREIFQKFINSKRSNFSKEQLNWINRIINKNTIPNENDSNTDIIIETKYGNLRFLSPNEIKYNKLKIIQVFLGKPKETSNNNTKEAQYDSSLIEANLSGGAFKIENICQAEQMINNGETIIWKWEIIPVSKEQGEIHLSKYELIGQTKNHKALIEPISHKISISNYFSFSNFFTSNWQWISGTILIPIFVFIWKKWLSKFFFS